MNLFLFLIILTVFLFLYSLFLIANDDSIFIRKGVSNEQIFNIGFLLLLVGLVSARIVYVFFNFTPRFLNPLLFLAIPYSPGLSLFGGILGGSLFLLGYTKIKRLSFGRIFDFFSFASFCSLGIGMLLFYLLDFFHTKQITPVIFSALYITIFIILTYIYLPKVKSGQSKEGVVSILYILSFSVVSLSLDIMGKSQKVFLFFGKDSIVLLVLILVIILIWIKQVLYKSRQRIPLQ